jgi:hypothetical protein
MLECEHICACDSNGIDASVFILKAKQKTLSREVGREEKKRSKRVCEVKCRRCKSGWAKRKS